MDMQKIQIPDQARCAIIRQFGDADVFEISEQPTPQIKRNQLLIKVHAASVNPIDWKQRMGNHRFLLGAPFPITLGYDVAGTVVKIGSEIRKFSQGDEVMGVLDNKYGGAYGTYAKGTEQCFVRRPGTLTPEYAAALPMVSLTALQALRDKGNLRPGQTLLVNGAGGGVGHIAVQIGKILGAHVIAVGSDESRDFVKQLEPDEFINYRETDILKSDRKVDVFFDVAGIYNFPDVHAVLNHKGTYINTLPRPKILWHKLLQLFSNGKKVKTLLMKHNAADLQQIVNWVKQEQMSVHIDSVFPLEAIDEAHRYAEKGHSKGKNIIKMMSDS